MSLLKVHDLRKIYRNGGNIVPVLHGLNFEIGAGEFVGIVGASGSGKSTLLHILGTLDSPTGGQIFIDGQDPFQESDKKRSDFRNLKMGFVFQQSHLLPELSALENVMLPALMAQKKPQEALSRAEHLLETVGLTSRLKHFPGQLSGGEQQRVAIARSLVNEPKLLLADEPSGNLDSRNAEMIHELFFNLHEKYKTTVVIVTHNLAFAELMPRVITLKDGQILQDTLLRKVSL